LNTADLLDYLTARGLRLRLDHAGHLLASPKTALTPDLADLIRAHRAALVAALRPPDPDAVREFYEERAAIFEYDANQPRAQAEAAALRRTVEHFHLPAPGAGGIAAVLAALAARGAEPSHPETRSPSHD